MIEYEFLLGRMGVSFASLTCSSTKAYLGHFALLGQYQEWMELLSKEYAGTSSMTLKVLD